jgi:CRP/FNR family transcriptional regulator/CRP/FNR family cyclic AMP-dependent transcriptional regulator
VKELEDAAHLRTFESGNLVVKQGDPPTEVLVIRSGSLRIFVDDPDGTRRDVRTLGPGQILGELGVVGGHHRTASAEALEQSEVWMIDRDAFASVYRSDPQVTIEIAKVMAPYILENDELAVDVLAMDLRGRVAKRLLELSRIDGPVTMPRLAMLSGGPQSQVIRIVERFREFGLIELSSEGITVVDSEQLEHFAGH